MRIPTSIKPLIAVLSTICGLGVLSAPAFAETPGPGWELTSRTFPTNLPPAVNDVQQITVNATGGTFTLTFLSPTFEENTTVAISHNAEIAVVQADLEALPEIGAGNVAVTGVPGSYVITFTGRLGARDVSKLTANAGGLTGGAQTATVAVQSEGAGRGTVEVDIVNVGKAPSEGPITVTDTLPEGLTAISAGETQNIFAEDSSILHSLWNCTGNGLGKAVLGATVVTCTNEPSGFVYAGGGGGPGSTTGENLQPELGIAVRTESREVIGTNRVTIAGGGAPTPASTTSTVKVSSTPAEFGFTGWDGWFSNADGTLDTQAGSHPYEATFSFDLPTLVQNTGFPELRAAGGEVRNLVVDLPPGLVGNPNAVPQCTRQQLDAIRCPNASQIGSAMIFFGGGSDQEMPRVYNMVPPPGVPAEFGFLSVEGINSYLDNSVRSGSDYGITTEIDNTPTRSIVHVVTTLWGVPGDPSHVIWRESNQPGCSKEQIERIGGNAEDEQKCKPVGSSPKPFLTLPTECGEPQKFTIRANTWQHPDVWRKAEFSSHDAGGLSTGFTGCEDVLFGPLVSTSPDTARGDTPAGLTVEVKPPIGGLEDPEGRGSSDIQNTTVTLPEGFVINPGQAAGLQACQASQDGLTTEAEKMRGEEDNGPPSCPGASKVGTVKIKSPLIEGAAEKEFEGNVYVLQSNPPELKLLVAASADGVNLKLVGVVHLNEQTGRLTTTFQGTPELPFTVFKLSFSGGPQAALDTPTQCGVYTTGADFTAWGSPFVSDFLTNATFGITEGPGGSPCSSSPLPFAPTLSAGSTTDQAGGFTNFSLLLQRGDGQQRIERLAFREPAGLAGMISSVPLCPEPQASKGECSDVSKIGHAAVASGPGPYPLVIPQPGNPESPIFLTGPYAGAPFGLSIVTHVIAGPFDLGTIITRAKIEIDPHTAQITVTTDPFPQIVDGVPTDLRLINSVIDRPGFLFNPTNCSPQEFTGTAWGTPPPGAGGPGATAAISSHFGVGSCQSLKFKPKFSASASGKNSKAGGASLDVKVAYPSEPQGSEANIAKVKVDLPKQLPSRLTTLQKACTAAQFNTNPAGCPSASVVGHAIVHTSVLPVPLEGPAYFVSNGGEAFPNLIMVLQGYGVTVDLVGDTFINKAGITSSTFKTVPDVPFNTFELVLPQGPTSALATDVPAKAQYSLCGQKLTMPTELIAQNGATIDQSTPIAINGCAKKKSLTRAQKLVAALKVCHKKHNKAKRASCERQAHRKYGVVKKRKK
jgi:uncharacterized repeat protein (TIGR01451 family)